MPAETKKRIVIIGGGFAGIAAALRLNRELRRSRDLRENWAVTLINNHHSHLYTPALYEIAAIPLGEHTLKFVKSSITIPLADIFEGTDIEWRERNLIRIDAAGKTLEFENTEKLTFDYLIAALGSETAYFDIPGLREHSFPLKTFGDAIRLRDKVEAVISSGGDVHIVIGGAGATGVEVAAEFENFICAMQKRDPGNSKCRVSVTIVEGSPEILPGFSSWVIKKTRNRLAALNIDIRTQALVTSVDEKKIVLKDGTALPYTIFVWAGGVAAPAVLRTAGLPLSKKGGLVVNEFLEAAPGIYAAGDNSAFANLKTSQPLPWNVPVAEAEGKIAADNVVADIAKRSRRPFPAAARYPFILALGNTYAVADLVYFKFSGRLAWLLKLLVELRYLCSILPWWAAAVTWWKYVKVSRSNDARALTKNEPVH